MNSKRASLCSVIAGFVCCGCGNYSNDDLDFQLALPAQSDMEAKMQLSVLRPDSAEYYRDTRNAIASFNTMVDELARQIDLVRGIVPTSRNNDERTWGPWPAEKQPGWEIRVVMRRTAISEIELQMDYRFEVRPEGTGDSRWVIFLTGSYQSSGSTRTGQRTMQLLVGKVREAGFPVDTDPGLSDLVQIQLSYSNTPYPIQVSLLIEKLATSSTRSGLLVYQEYEDGSGSLTFDWEVMSDTGGMITAQMLSKWIGSGAGRADLTADIPPSQTGVITTLGIDCWGADSVATYSYRIGEDPLKSDQSTCLF
jgi:hypothetical protein